MSKSEYPLKYISLELKTRSKVVSLSWSTRQVMFPNWSKPKIWQAIKEPLSHGIHNEKTSFVSFSITNFNCAKNWRSWKIMTCRTLIMYPVMIQHWRRFCSNSKIKRSQRPGQSYWTSKHQLKLSYCCSKIFKRKCLIKISHWVHCKWPEILLKIIRCFSRKTKLVDFDLGNGIKFNQMVVINTISRPNAGRFGVQQTNINNFIDALLKMEVEGRRVRTQYKIPLNSGAPQAENFLWTILGNKVRKFI